MQKLFKRLLDLLNIHPDENQRWTLSTLFIVGLLDAYVGPAISKAWVTELPAEWLAFQSLVYSVVGLFIGMIWKGWVRRKAIQWFTVLCVIESAAGFCVGMWLCFVEYNVWVLAIACLLYGTLVSEFIGKCLMTFRPKLWNEHEREVYDNNNDVVCGIYCIAGYVCALLFMPSLKVAMFIWGLCCAIDNIGWLVVYHRNKDKFTEDWAMKVKELSIEEKARRYDRAIEKLRGMMPNWERLSYNGKTFLQDLVHIIPELAESGDERIRKELIRETKGSEIGLFETVTNEEFVAWLERRREQKPAEWSKEDKTMFDEIIDFFENGTVKLQHDLSLYASWLKTLKERVQPQKRWKPSDEHIYWLKWAINRMPDTEKANEAEAVLEDLLEQLKKLKG